MTRDLGVPGYQGYLKDNCVTIAEVLRAAGYVTLMSGKWHVGGEWHPQNPPSSFVGDRKHPVPTQRGFDRFFGILTGATSYFNPSALYRDDQSISADSPDFYLTDAISDNAVEMVRESSSLGRPFFLCLAYTAPHWPLQALPDDIARYEGAYRLGWDHVRTSRHEQMRSMGLVDPRWPISPRDAEAPPWEEVKHKDWEALRMAVYAAQIDCMDRGIGRVLTYLRESDQEQNTLVMFLSDNGGCAELFQEDTSTPRPSAYGRTTFDGRTVHVGNNPEVRPGPDDTYMSYDLPWANVSDAPFRLFKRWTHEGGISTPFIVRWPGRIKETAIVHEPAHLVDIVATCIEAAGASYPSEFTGNPIVPLEGESFASLFDGRPWSRHQPVFWEHEGNRAVRIGQWKLVSEYPHQWELYDMEADRTELDNRAGKEARRVSEMAALYQEWAEPSGVLPWPVDPQVTGGILHGKHDHIIR